MGFECRFGLGSRDCLVPRRDERPSGTTRNRSEAFGRAGYCRIESQHRAGGVRRVFFEGGYVPMLIGATLIAGMLIWSRGRTALMDQYSRRYSTFEKAKPRGSIGSFLRGYGARTVVVFAAFHDETAVLQYARREKFGSVAGWHYLRRRGPCPRVVVSHVIRR
jgi:hypothetical protein